MAKAIRINADSFSLNLAPGVINAWVSSEDGEKLMENAEILRINGAKFRRNYTLADIPTPLWEALERELAQVTEYEYYEARAIWVRSIVWSGKELFSVEARAMLSVDTSDDNLIIPWVFEA